MVTTVKRANRDEPFYCPHCQSHAIEVVTLGPSENAITVRCADCEQHTIVVFEYERDAASWPFDPKRDDDPTR